MMRRLEVSVSLSQVVQYYIAQSKSSNHGVREAACACIAELMEKVGEAVGREDQATACASDDTPASCPIIKEAVMRGQRGLSH